MQPFKPHRIDLNADYPCPCGRKGKILPIALTEALGCNRCQHIFTLDEKGYYLEQLTTAYSSGRKAWYWNGSQWSALKPKIRERLLAGLFYVLLILLFLGIGLVSATWVPFPIVIVIGIGVAVLALLIVLGLIFYR